MTAFELISDLHKDARGFRPSAGWMSYFDGLSDVAKEETWESLCDELDQRERQEAIDELNAQRVYENRISGMMSDYSISRATAMRWDAEAFDVDIEGTTKYHGCADQEIEFYLYKQGIAVRMFPMYVAELTAAFGH